MLLISYSLFKENELCTFQLNRRSYVLLRRAIMTLHLFSFLYVFFFFHFCRAVIKSRGPGIFPGYFHRKQNKNRARRTFWLYNSPPTNRICPATCRFVSLEFSPFGCVSLILNSSLYVTFLPDQRREKHDLLSFVDLPSPLCPLPSLFSSPLSPKEGLILRLLRLRSKSNSLSEPFYINHTIFW